MHSTTDQIDPDSDPTVRIKSQNLRYFRGPDPGRYYRLSHTVRSGKGIKRSKERAREREIERELHYKNAYHFHLCLTKPRHLAMAQPQSNGVDTKYLEKKKKKKKRRVVVWIRKPLSLLRPSCLMVAANADPPAIAGEGGDGAERRIPTHLVVMVNGLVGRCVILHLGRTFDISSFYQIFFCRAPNALVLYACAIS